MNSSASEKWMAAAIDLARRGWYSASPNPRVGCVLVKNNQIVAEGWHEQAGQAHAEAMALANAGSAARGCEAYITLEPCSFHGRTPACSQSLIDAGVTKVVCAMLDPHAKVAGSGLRALEAAGVETQVGLLEQQARELNPGYIQRHETGRPRLRCKLAASIDGRTAMASGESQWITGPEARADVQRLRAESCVVLTGINTVVDDDPSLTVRDAGLLPQLRSRQAIRAVMDRQGRLAASANLFNDSAPVLQFSTTQAKAKATLKQCDVYCSDTADLEPAWVLEQLAGLECNEVLLECGPTLAAAFLRAECVDQFVFYVAPKILGSAARPLLNLPLDTLSDSPELEFESVEPVGNDLRIMARPIY